LDGNGEKSYFDIYDLVSYSSINAGVCHRIGRP